MVIIDTVCLVLLKSRVRQTPVPLSHYIIRHSRGNWGHTSVMNVASRKGQYVYVREFEPHKTYSL